MSNTGQSDNFSGVLELTAPTGGVVIGQFYSMGNTQVVARATADAGDKFPAQVKGVVWAVKDAGTGKTLSRGNAIKVTSNKAVAAVTGDAAVAVVLEDAAATDEKVKVEMLALPAVIA